jgi:hypothetical protein
MKGGRLAIAVSAAVLLGAIGLAAPVGATGGRLPAPTYGKTVNLRRVSGVVRVRPPGAGGLSRLRGARQVPVGTVVDVTGGRVRLTSAADAGSRQSADFFYGEFRVTQPNRGRPITVLRLIESLVCGPLRKRAGASRAQAHGLWGSGKGNFRTVGDHGAATVRGTIWWSRDRCDGTLFRVKRGVVAIRDFSRHRTVRIRAGMRYLAPVG